MKISSESQFCDYREPGYGSSFVYNIRRLWNTFRTTPEGNEIKDFNVSFSFYQESNKNIRYLNDKT